MRVLRILVPELFLLPELIKAQEDCLPFVLPEVDTPGISLDSAIGVNKLHQRAEKQQLIKPLF